jgi:membrane associated rhomboid family serine protease
MPTRVTFQMTNCTSCGRELSAVSGRSAGRSLCADCERTDLPSAASRPPAQPQYRATVAGRTVSLTTLLVGINVTVFVIMVLTGVSPLTPSTPQLLRWGANWGPLSLGPQPWRMLTSNYVHGGLIHIFFNMWCLLNLGALAERMC